MRCEGGGIKNKNKKKEKVAKKRNKQISTNKGFSNIGIGPLNIFYIPKRINISKIMGLQPRKSLTHIYFFLNFYQVVRYLLWNSDGKTANRIDCYLWSGMGLVDNPEINKMEF